MDDKDRIDESRGATDALRPQRAGGDAKSEGETDQRPDPANAITGGKDDQRAAGTIDDPLAPGDGAGSVDYQTGDLGELAQQRGGPVDVSRDRPARQK